MVDAVFLLVIVVAVVVALFLFFYFIPVGLWISALAARVRIGIGETGRDAPAARSAANYPRVADQRHEGRAGDPDLLSGSAFPGGRTRGKRGNGPYRG